MRHAIAGHAVNTTYTDVGSADIAGANICHPCKLDISIPAADGPATACRIINLLISNSNSTQRRIKYLNVGIIRADAQYLAFGMDDGNGSARAF